MPSKFVHRLAGLCLASAAALAGAAELAGTHRLVLANAAGERIDIGTVTFRSAGTERWRFDIKLDDARFEERFLAMRPFKCLTGPSQQICWFPYGEEREITRDDLVPLEYALLFLHKKPASVNIDAKNGVYYKLRWSAAGARSALEGTLWDADYTPIIVPEGGDRRRPVTADYLFAADPGSHWLPQLLIE
ncbi:MAG: hypothetical protein KF778_15420 [Rhodocyclaceae bacterium]|nr:hypothetical protein [Rhodocyclaceae bacterium]MBX3669790.1 hypothetical protein [Rhodocyclaceae bacterium]